MDKKQVTPKVEAVATAIIPPGAKYTINRHKLPDGSTLITIFVSKARSHKRKENTNAKPHQTTSVAIDGSNATPRKRDV